MSKRGIFGSHKVWRYPERIAAYVRGEVPPPVTMELDMTNACQHRCPGCAGGRQASASVRLREAQDWLAQMAALGVKGVIFTGGGEPLLNGATPDAMQAAANHGLGVGLITNGGIVPRLSDEAVAQIVGAATWVRVSLDASDAAMFIRTHGVDKFLDSIQGIQRLADAAPDDCTVGVGYLVNADTKRGMLLATKRMQTFGVDYIQFRPYHWDFTPIDDVLPLCRQHETDTFKVRCSEQKYARFGEWPLRPYDHCHGCFFAGVVQADGNMPLCCHLRGVERFYIGNLRERPLAEIWGGDRHRQAAASVDVAQCVPLCRCDEMNRNLDDAMTPKPHEEFL